MRGNGVSDWFDAGGTGSPADVSAMLDSRVPTLLAACVGMGALVSLGTTSDGGALGVTVTLDGKWRREYFRETEALEEWLTAAATAIGESGGSLPASSGPRQRRSTRRR